MNEIVFKVIYGIHKIIKFLIINTSAFVWGYFLYRIIGHIDIKEIFSIELPLLNFIAFVVIWFISCWFIYIISSIIVSYLYERFIIIQRYMAFIDERDN